jgi:transposase
VRADEPSPRYPGYPEPVVSTPRVLGIDDFAVRRGHVYATIVDITTGRPVDVLPDRTQETVVAWLHAHPGVQIVCRDRSGTYAEAVREAAPGAIQVADRWHLWHNLGEASRKSSLPIAHTLPSYEPTRTPTRTRVTSRSVPPHRSSDPRPAWPSAHGNGTPPCRT